MTIRKALTTSAALSAADVPYEKIDTAVSIRQRAAREKRFLLGPIRFSFLRDYIRDPADRLLLVLLAYSDMLRSQEFPVTSGILVDAGISDRKMAYRALAAVEAGGVFKVDRRRGRRPRVRLAVSK